MASSLKKFLTDETEHGPQPDVVPEEDVPIESALGVFLNAVNDTMNSPQGQAMMLPIGMAQPGTAISQYLKEGIKQAANPQLFGGRIAQRLVPELLDTISRYTTETLTRNIDAPSLVAFLKNEPQQASILRDITTEVLKRLNPLPYRIGERYKGYGGPGEHGFKSLSWSTPPTPEEFSRWLKRMIGGQDLDDILPLRTRIPLEEILTSKESAALGRPHFMEDEILRVHPESFPELFR